MQPEHGTAKHAVATEPSSTRITEFDTIWCRDSEIHASQRSSPLRYPLPTSLTPAGLPVNGQLKVLGGGHEKSPLLG